MEKLRHEIAQAKGARLQVERAGNLAGQTFLTRFWPIDRRPWKRGLLLLPGATIGVAALLGSDASTPRTRLIWNASSSVPQGLYLVLSAGEFRRGDMVVALPPPTVRNLAAERHYLPLGIPLLKHVSVLPGERLCAAASIITVGGRRIAKSQVRDPSGRPLPSFRGCRRLSKTQYLLLGGGALSFDGRYFGPSEQCDIIGRARLLWAR